MEREIILRGDTITHGQFNFVPSIRLHIHCFQIKGALAFHVSIDPVYVKIDSAGTSRILNLSNEEISADQFKRECPTSPITRYLD